MDVNRFNGQPAAITERMYNFFNIMEARLNPSTVLKINKIPVKESDSIKNMIKKLAKKSKDGEKIIMPGKSGYTRRKTPSPPSSSTPPPIRKGKSQARPSARQSVPSTATRKARPAVPHESPFYSVANDVLSMFFGTGR